MAFIDFELARLIAAPSWDPVLAKAYLAVLVMLTFSTVLATHDYRD